MLQRLETKLIHAVSGHAYWGRPYALARTLLATCSAITLALNPPGVLFRLRGGPEIAAACDRVSRFGLFCQVENLQWARWLAVAALLLVATGWRPRVTGVLHWWVTVSLQVNATLVDGGESVASVLTLFLIPLTLTDPRRSHWAPMPNEDAHPMFRARVVAATASLLLGLQVAVIYAHASIGKFEVSQWADGTALYYWLEYGAFRAPDWLVPLVRPLVRWAPSVTVLTWSVLVLEFLLGASLLMPPRTRRALFALAASMHLGILFVQGIASFAVTMLAALLLSVWPHRDRLPLESATRDVLGRLQRLPRRFGRQRADSSPMEQGKP